MNRDDELNIALTPVVGVPLADMIKLAAIVSDIDGKNIADNRPLAAQAHEIISSNLGSLAHVVYGHDEDDDRRTTSVLGDIKNAVCETFKKWRTA